MRNMSASSVSLLAAGILAAMALGGCQSAMYSGTPEDMSGSVAPAYGPDTYEPPYQVGGAKEGGAADQKEAEQSPDGQYVYRGGRDPVTGRAKTQM